jgi:pimeloyl-ACP methyl ester carboxylesterase
MNWLFGPPTLADLIRLLKSWRIWILAAAMGGMLGAAVYLVAPPPYRARATVLVDFNLEQAWPQDSDRQHFYYLEREARKLEEIAWSDAVLQRVADADGSASIGDLRDIHLRLSQPAEAGWHFYAQADNADRAQRLASAWARIFVEQAAIRIAGSNGLDKHIEVEATQLVELPTSREPSMGVHMLAGTMVMLLVASVLMLFFHPPAPARPR